MNSLYVYRVKFSLSIPEDQIAGARAMKRCPECDFLYEDDQRLCDMDGTALVHDSHVFPDSPLPAHQVAGHVWQRLAIALPLMVLAVLGFYVLKQQSPIPANHQMPAADSTPVQSSNGASASNSTGPETGSTISASGFESRSSVDAGASIDAWKRTSTKAKPEAPKAEDPNPILTAPESAADTKETPASSADPSAKPSEKPLRTRNTSVRRVSTANDQGKDSKVASFLKKTGRILKKPFKL
jgi:cytoskeletal protein RodZ